MSALFNLDLMSLPNAEPLIDVMLGLSVADQNGQVYSKQISKSMEEDILALINSYLDALKADGKEEPFMLDGPDMEYTPPWTEFTISRSDSNSLNIFWFTVIDQDPDALVTGECRDKDGHFFAVETGISISVETLQTLQWMGLEHLSDEEEWPADLEVPLDDSKITLTLTFPDGTIARKKASMDLSSEIYKLLLPYFKIN